MRELTQHVRVCSRLWCARSEQGIVRVSRCSKRRAQTCGNSSSQCRSSTAPPHPRFVSLSLSSQSCDALASQSPSGFRVRARASCSPAQRALNPNVVRDKVGRVGG